MGIPQRDDRTASPPDDNPHNALVQAANHQKLQLLFWVPYPSRLGVFEPPPQGPGCLLSSTLVVGTLAGEGAKKLGLGSDEGVDWAGESST